MFNTALGITIYETGQATAGTVLGFNSRRGGRFSRGHKQLAQSPERRLVGSS